MMFLHYEEMKCFLTVQETARLLDVSVHTIYKLIHSGALAATKISPRRTRIKAEEIKRFINEK